MPLTLRKNIENGEIGLWKITEEIDELYSNLFKNLCHAPKKRVACHKSASK
jgi:hypothetical protein